MTTIYVASSWRNERYFGVVESLRAAGFKVHDWRSGEYAFSWSEIDPNWKNWTPEEYRTAMAHERAVRGLHDDFTGMKKSSICVLLLPCGKSAHVEAGWMAGFGKPVVVYQPPMQDGEHFEPELMYGLFSSMVLSIGELIDELKFLERNLS